MKFRLSKFFIIFCLLFIGSFACRKYFQKINTDTKSLGANDVDAKSLFSFAQKSLSDYFASPSVNSNVSRFFAQYISPTQYTGEARFNIISRNISSNIFDALYTSVLNNLKRSREVILEKNPENKAQLGMIGILEVYTYAFLVEVFGDIPYTEALNPDNITPVYDDAKTVYLNLVKKLDEHLSTLRGGGESMGIADLVYQGDTAKWCRFGNSLKLKMALMLAKCNNSEAKKMAEAAMSQVFRDKKDSYIFNYTTEIPNTNPFYSNQVYSSRNDFAGVNHFIDTMKHWCDPRLPCYFDTVLNNSEKVQPKKVKTGYDTSRYKGAVYAVITAKDKVSQPYNIKLAKPEAPGILLDYAEVQFYLAEACCRGLINKSMACDYFKKGIEASVCYWKGDTTNAKCWIEKESKKLTKNNCMNQGNSCNSMQGNVGEGETGGQFNFNLAMHMWVALYNRGYAGWNVWRRFGKFPKFFEVKSDSYNQTVDNIPWRLTYPIDEGNKNQANVSKAAGNIGGDQLTTKLFFFK